jgi:hypothetical protein
MPTYGLRLFKPLLAAAALCSLGCARDREVVRHPARSDTLDAPCSTSDECNPGESCQASHVGELWLLKCHPAQKR